MHPRSSTVAFPAASGPVGCGGKSEELVRGGTANASKGRRFVRGVALLLVTASLVGCSSPDDSSPKSEQQNAWSGHTYLLSIVQKQWSVPRGIGMDLFGVAPAFILKVNGTGNNLTAMLATGPGVYLPDPTDKTKQVAVTLEQAAQDSCGVTTDIPFAGGTYPHSVIAPSGKISMFVRNDAPTTPLQVTADVYGLKFTDVLPNGATPATTGTLEAMMDFRELYLLFASLGPTRNEDTVCASLMSHYSMPDAGVVVQCEPCPDGAPYCLSVKAEQIGAVEAPNLAATEISLSSRAATCADSPKPQ